MEITKQGSQYLRMEMRNAELNLKGAKITYGLQSFTLACSRIAETSVKVGMSRLQVTRHAPYNASTLVSVSVKFLLY